MGDRRGSGCGQVEVPLETLAHAIEIITERMMMNACNNYGDGSDDDGIINWVINNVMMPKCDRKLSANGLLTNAIFIFFVCRGLLYGLVVRKSNESLIVFV